MTEGQKNRRKKRERIKLLSGFALFFLNSFIAVCASAFVYQAVTEKTQNEGTVYAVMLCLAVFLAAVMTGVDYLRRRFSVQKQILEILNATERIADGDFSVRLSISSTYDKYDDFDYVKENLNKMAEELSKTETLRMDFVSSVSHEIKTPLSIIRNYAKALAKRDLDESTRARYAESLVDGAERLTSLVGNILKLNKLENLEIVPELEIIDLTENLRECILGMEEAIDRKNIELACDLDEVTVFALPDLLEIVWNNLLSNAVKFTDEGGRVEVSLKETEGYAVVTVRDSGCGIPADAGARIFEKFYQADPSRAKQGNGLGLALVKRVIDLSGGEISVKSKLGEGTVFTVKLKSGKNHNFFQNG